ncbi:NFACT family protein [uncultured Ilyobacter sp.]|uniref:Rqc2 family fibronectin-binding protein n=1 Tax=uncultured Ilyobacter sp. TaxID=544433 RepID=UPI002AA73014|nr:NFACT family protein [uncultured Ilyobacter sp.]
MLYLDGISINKLKDELSEVLTGRKITKVFQYSRLSTSIFFGKLNMFFSCNASLPVCYLKDNKENAPETPMSFSLNLRKYLLNSIITEVSQLGYDRILVFKFRKLNELGEYKEYMLYFEIMGKHSNLILTAKDGEILDLMKKFSLEENKLRVLLPGAKYSQPVTEKKISPADIPQEKLEEMIGRPKEMVKSIEGLGMVAAKAIETTSDFFEVLNNKGTPTVYYKNRKINLASVFQVKNADFDRKEEFETINKMINFYIEATKSSESYNNLYSSLLNVVEKEIKKNKRTLKILEKEMDKNRKHEKSKEIGDILAANLYSIKRGQKEAVLFDFYNNCETTISLDPNFSPKENLDRYYKKYNKLKRGFEFNLKRYQEVKNEIDYLQGVKSFLEESSTMENLNTIKDELVAGKYIKAVKTLKKKKTAPLNYGIIEFEEYQILYGRNNLENDNLSFKIADRNDMWLHSKEVPGSHVIIRWNGEFTEEVIFKGAEVAAFYSKTLPGEKVLIDYTLKKYLNKPKGGKPGFVTYNNQESILVVKPESI